VHLLARLSSGVGRGLTVEVRFVKALARPHDLGDVDVVAPAHRVALATVHDVAVLGIRSCHAIKATCPRANDRLELLGA